MASPAANRTAANAAAGVGEEEEGAADGANSSAAPEAEAADDAPGAPAAAEAARTIDSFLEAAYHHHHHLHPSSAPNPSPAPFSPSPSTTTSGVLSDMCDRSKLSYHCMYLALGLANAADAAEILSLSYLLSEEGFRNDILHQSGGDTAGGNDHSSQSSSSSSFESGLIAAAVFGGMLSGGLLGGCLSDAATIGRRPTLLYGLAINALAGTLSAFVAAGPRAAHTLAFIRFVGGMGIGAGIPPLFALGAELAPPSRRGRGINVVASFWMVGAVYVALMTILSFQWWGWSWRVFAVLCAVPSMVGTVAVGWAVPQPDSPRFLARWGRAEEAAEVANVLATRMGATATATARISCGVYETVRVEEDEEDGCSSATCNAFRMLRAEELAQQYPPQSQSPESTQSTQLIRRNLFDIKSALTDGMQSARDLYHPNLRNGITLPLQLIWFTLSFGSYGLLTWINSIFVAVHLDNVYFNALLFAVANLPGNILAGALMDRADIGRRRLLTMTLAGSALSLLVFAHYARIRPDADANTAMIVLSACSFQAFSIASWHCVDTITGEEFPTSVRSTGMGICTASGRIGALIAQFVNSWLIDEPARLLLVASATLLFGAASPRLLEGTDMAGRSLEDDASEHHRNITIDSTQQPSATGTIRNKIGYNSLHASTGTSLRRGSSGSRPPVSLTILSLVSLLSVHPASGLSLPPPAPRPECYKTAADIPAPPIDDNPFEPSILDDALVAAFRWTLQRQSGEVSDILGFDGMMRELIDYRVEHGPDELERVSYQTMIALAGPVPFIYRNLFGSLEATPAILAWFAKFLLPFLVGEMSLTSRGGDDLHGGGVLVHRCRVLEGSGCKGVSIMFYFLLRHML